MTQHLPEPQVIFMNLNLILGREAWNGVFVLKQQCTVFWKAYILSGSGFHEFLYSIIESFKKNREIAEFIPNQLRFHEKNFS